MSDQTSNAQIDVRPWAAAIAALYGLLVWRFWFICDDAYITFRYAKNLVNGHGFRFNVGDDPIEGYSNFLWLWVAAAQEFIGLNPATLTPALSAVLGGVLLWRVYVVARRDFEVSAAAALWGVLPVATAPTVAIWATSGLETMPFALLVFLTFETLGLGRGARWLWALSAVGLILVRPEGLGWVLVLSILGALVRVRDGKQSAIDTVRAMAPVVLGVLAFFALYEGWRWVTFSDWVPNTAHAKVGLASERWVRGAKYLGLYWMTFPAYPLAFAAVISAISRRMGAGITVGLMALAFPVWGIVVGGDFFPMGRMLLPGLPFMGVLVAVGVQALMDGGRARVAQGVVLASTVLCLLPAVNVHVFPESVRSMLHFRLSDREFLSEVDRWDNLVKNTWKFELRGRALGAYADPGDSIVARAIGAMGYYSDLYVYDQYGLVNREVAMIPDDGGPLDKSPGHDKEVEPIYFVDQEPDLLFARYVLGRGAAVQMKDSLSRWEVPASLRDMYVPDFEEMTLPGEEHAGYLFVVRLANNGEGLRTWKKFEQRRKALHKELIERYPKVEPR